MGVVVTVVVAFVPMISVLLVPVLFFVRMLFMTVILMAMLIMSVVAFIMRMVVVVVTVMLIVVIMRLMVMIAVVLIPMHMRLEQRTLPERQFRRSIDLKEFSDTGVASQCFDRTVKPLTRTGFSEASNRGRIGVMEKDNGANRYSPETRARAVRMVLDNQGN